MRIYMKLYHFTSLENWDKIKDGVLGPRSLYKGKTVLWLTKEREKRHQYWAVGEHKNKTEVRIRLSTLNFEKLKLPQDSAEKADLFKLGAFAVDLWTEQCSEECKVNPERMNWYTSENEHPYPLAIEVYSRKTGKYSLPAMSPEEERKFIICKLAQFNSVQQTAKWYKWRWNEYYCKKYNIKFEEIFS